jgi:large subunit ribosomal protein L15
MPKYGFKNINRVEYKAINLSTIDALATSKSLKAVGLEELQNAGLVSKNQLVKVLANGNISVAVAVSANAFSKKAEEAIVAAGGSVVKIGAAAPEKA